jgi:phosphatidylserine/phosphatidylglycerophosphate/cardiolipin synthase-like enzyme
MSSESFTSVGPGKGLAYIRGDLRTATQSFFLIGPWLDDYVAQQMLLVASRTLRARVLVRSERQVEPEVWERIVASLSAFAGHWATFEARTLDRLHAKCLLIDERIAYVGSANWYRYSLEDSLEIVLRGPMTAVAGLQQDCETLWEQAHALAVPSLPKAVRVPATGITHEVLDPLAAQVLKDNPKAFILRKKKRTSL